MRGPGLYGYPPQDVRWSGDSLRVYFKWKKYDEPVLKEASTYVVNRDGTGLRKLDEDEERLAPPPVSDDTRNWKIALYSEDGDVFLYDRISGRRHQVTHTDESESQPRFTHDEKQITFVRNNNLYRLSPADGSIEQLTDIRRGESSPSPQDPEKKGTDSQEFLKKEERSLLDIVRDRAAKREADLAKKKKQSPRKPFRLSSRQRVTSLSLSPDGSFVLALVSESAEKSKETVVPNYITENGYTTDISSRTNVGDEQSRTRVAFLDVKTGDVKWLEHGIKEPGESKDAKPRDRELRLSTPRWSDDGKYLAMLGRGADNKDAWIFAIDPATAKTRALATVHDDAWVTWGALSDFGWIPASKRLYYSSERDGWNHLYTVDYEGGEARQLTQGNWEVRDVKLNPERTQFLLGTSEVHPGEDHLYSMSFDGGERKRLTTMSGGNDAVMSPDGTMLANVYSYTNRPPELYLQDLRQADIRPIKVTASPAPEFSNYSWLDAPIVSIPARDGEMVPARMFKPKVWKKGGPLIVFVHGAGYLQNVHRHWSSYSREYLFHHLLVDRGYMVLDVDYRASAGYGRNWRTAIYEHMGGKDLDDQVDAVRWAIKEHGVNPKRVGIYGGSYGGFITLMAMFTQPDVFQAGASLRPVTDWAHYNHGYTSNILNTPQKDEEAYRRSSPIYHAKGLKGALLICHGMVDTNVHFQDTVRLTQKLIELRKENWELAVYPVEDHGFQQPSSWADEYRRILKLFDTNLKR